MDEAESRHHRLYCVALTMAVGCLVHPPQLRGQTVVELAGGWTEIAQPSTSTAGHFGHGLAIRASVGWALRPGVDFRIDGMEVQFDRTQQFFPPCPAPGCTGPSFETQQSRVEGLTANAIVHLDKGGIVYVIGGAGLYDSRVEGNEVKVGVALGSGMALPIGGRLRAVFEGRWHWLAGSADGPPWLVPVTVGLRVRV